MSEHLALNVAKQLIATACLLLLLASKSQSETLDETRDLTVARAEELADVHDDVVLPNVAAISTDVARALAAHKGACLTLGLEQLPSDVAEELAQHQGLCLKIQVAALSSKAAKALSQKEGGLYLNGLKELSTEAAESLSNHEGELHLDGLVDLSPEAAKALAGHYGALHLDGLVKISPSVAAAVAGIKGERITTIRGADGRALATKTKAPVLSLN